MNFRSLTKPHPFHPSPTFYEPVRRVHFYVTLLLKFMCPDLMPAEYISHPPFSVHLSLPPFLILHHTALFLTAIVRSTKSRRYSDLSCATRLIDKLP